jgi:uncharacterized protein YkwD
MSNHRRKRHYRKTVIAAVAITAVGVPSVAMACMDRQDDATTGRYAHWQRASLHHWTKGSWSPKPTATASQTPTTAATTPTAKPTGAATTPAPATPSKTPATSAAPASGATARVVQLVNSERGKNGCAPLTVNAKLTRAAQDHTADMAAHRTMSHTGSDGSSPGDRITAAGYSWRSYGENVAYGYSTPESVMTAWMNSPGHRANILNCAFKEIGVGYAQPGNYWTQDFATAR